MGFRGPLLSEYTQKYTPLRIKFRGASQNKMMDVRHPSTEKGSYLI